MSATPVILGVTRTNLGPFTTNTWSYSCNEVILGGGGDGWAAQTCIIDGGGNNRPTDNQDCWPPRATDVPGTTEALHGWGVYSPGISCPQGYTSVAASTYGGKANFRFQFPLTAGETAIGCCPKGDYVPILDAKGAQTCLQTEPTTTFLLGSCDGKTPVYRPFAVPGTLDNTVYQNFRISAPMFQMVYQQSDTIPKPSTPSPINPADSSKGGNGNGNDSSGSKGGLSTAATAGIAIGAALAVILATTAVFCLWRSRRRKQQYADIPTQQQYGSDDGISRDLKGHYGADYHQSGPHVVGGVYELKGEVMQADSRPVNMPVEMGSEAPYGELESVNYNYPSQQPAELGGGHEDYRYHRS